MDATVTVLAMVHENEVDPAYVAPSVAVTVTEETPGVVGVPVMDPVEELIDRPAGRPEALQVRVAPDWESVAALVKVEMAEPEALDLAPGLVTTTVLVVFHVKEAEPE